MGTDFTVMTGDCKKLMKSMPDDYVNAVVTDPPYGTGAWVRPDKGLGRDCRAVQVVEDWDVWSTDWLDDAWRVARSAVGLFVPCRELLSLLSWVADRPWRMFVWVKPDPRPRFGGQPAYGFDPFVVVGKVQPCGGKDYTVAASPRQESSKHHGHDPKLHQHQKRVKLMSWCVRLCCPERGVVLDPFMGSGSTGVACLQTTIRFIGIEQDQECAVRARKRLARRGRCGLEGGDKPAGFGF